MAGAQVSPNNSTIVPLGIGGVFLPAAFEDVYQFDNVCVVVLADVASAAGGLVLAWSNDSVTATITETRTLAAGVPMIYESTTRGQGFRVSLTNGGVAQASLTIQTIYRNSSSPVIRDIQDGFGDSIMDPTLNAMKVSLVAPATVPISATSLPLPTGAATDASLGSLTETAPATDIASSGLNGRLQRIAQRITSLIALLPSALIGGRLDVNLGAAPATVTVTVADGTDVALGATTDAAASTDAGTFSLIALVKRLLQKLTTQLPAALTGSGSLKVAVVEALTASDVVIGRVKLTDGVTVADVRDLVNSNALNVAIVDSNGDQIVSFGTAGNKSNNAAAPAADNLGVLGAVATAVAPTYVEGRLVTLSTDLAGGLRTSGSSGGSSGDTETINGIEMADVHDPLNRRLLEELLAEMWDLKERMFAQ